MRRTRNKRKTRHMTSHRKSRKHIRNKRRNSRRRVMRGGNDDDDPPANPETIDADNIPVVINDETFSNLNVLTDGNYILIGYGYIIVNSQNTFVLFNKTNKKYYYYNYENNQLENINRNKDVTIHLSYYTTHDNFLYGDHPSNPYRQPVERRQDHYDKEYKIKIQLFFKMHTTIKKLKPVMDQNVENGKVPYPPFIITLNNITFNNFHIPHEDTYLPSHLTVHAYGFFSKNGVILPIFIFKDKDKDKDYYLNIDHPIEKMLKFIPPSSPRIDTPIVKYSSEDYDDMLIKKDDNGILLEFTDNPGDPIVVSQSPLL